MKNHSQSLPKTLRILKIQVRDQKIIIHLQEVYKFTFYFFKLTLKVLLCSLVDFLTFGGDVNLS